MRSLTGEEQPHRRVEQIRSMICRRDVRYSLVQRLHHQAVSRPRLLHNVFAAFEAPRRCLYGPVHSLEGKVREQTRLGARLCGVVHPLDGLA